MRHYNYIRSAFMCRILLLLTVSFAKPVAVLSQTNPQYNVLFVAVDDMNDRVDFLGNPEPVSPNLTRLLNRGMVFKLAYCQFPVCNPSRTSLLSGWRPDKTGIFTNHVRPRSVMGPHVKFLPEYFKQYGYRTERYGKIMHTLFENDIAWDFAEPPESTKNEDISVANTSADDSIGPDWWINNKPDSLRTEGIRARNLVRRMQEPQPSLFFYALGLSVHHSFTPSLQYWNLNGDPSVQELLPVNASGKITNLKGNGSGNIAIPYSPPGDRNDAPSMAFPYQEIVADSELKRVIHAYDAEVAQMDAQLGLVLDEMDRQDLWKNTIVVFWSDHGQHLGEHEGLWGKSTLFEESLHVPLIICVPGKPAGVCNKLVELVDIYPTLTELCGLPAPLGMEGFSFAPLLDDPNKEWKKAAFSQTRNSPVIMGRSVTASQYRYNSWGTAGEELYDHFTDPHEYTNLANKSQSQTVLNEMRAILAGGWQQALPPNIMKTFYKDNDADGFGNSNDFVRAYTAPVGYVISSGDCNDNNPSVKPGPQEKPCNGIDDNCDGRIDENKPVATVSASGSLDICAAGSVILTANESSNTTYQWRRNGVNISGATNRSYTATTTGNYAVTITNTKNGCSSTSPSRTVTNSCAIALSSQITALDVVTPSLKFSVYPNPSKGNITVHFNSHNAGVSEIKVYDIAGKVVFAKTENVTKGNNIINLQLNRLAAGLYSLEIKNMYMQQQLKLLIEK